MDESVRPINQEDILLWPDGFWCLRCEHSEGNSGRSDDFEVIRFGTDRYNSIQEA